MNSTCKGPFREGERMGRKRVGDEGSIFLVFWLMLCIRGSQCSWVEADLAFFLSLRSLKRRKILAPMIVWSMFIISPKSLHKTKWYSNLNYLFSGAFLHCFKLFGYLSHRWVLLAWQSIKIIIIVLSTASPKFWGTLFLGNTWSRDISGSQSANPKEVAGSRWGVSKGTNFRFLWRFVWIVSL